MFNEDIEKLVQEFHLISSKGWIKSINNSTGSIGLTFEKQLNKQADSTFFPDYYGIEIKCLGRYSWYPITLFTCSFDGPNYIEINRIVEKYGYYDKDFTDKKVLFERLSFNNMCLVNNLFYFKLELDENLEKVFLCVYDFNLKLIERESFVYFYSLYNHLMLKLNRLALVRASKKIVNGVKYFRYYKITIYDIISFDRFKSLLLSGDVMVSLISRISKSGNDAGRYRNKNLVFQIKNENLNKLFEEIYCFNKDYNYLFNKKTRYKSDEFLFGSDEWIRTTDLLGMNQVL